MNIYFKKIKSTTAYVLALLLLCQCIFVPECFGAVITEKEISEGLAFCSEYPVQLTYEGEIIRFSDKDVPPVIITPAGEKNGRTLIPVRALLEIMGASVSWINETKTVEIDLDGSKIELVIESDIAKVDGEEVKLDVPALIIDHDGDYYGSTMIPVRFVAETLHAGVSWENESRTVAVTAPDSAEPADTVGGLFPAYEYEPLPHFTSSAAAKLIAIDSGHGGNDPGAIGHQKQSDRLNEKDVNLPVALKLCEYLKAAGGNVYMLKTEDKAINIYERPAIANAAGADFFVSCHNNSSESSKSHGSMAIYSSKLYYGMNDEGRAITIVSRAVEWAASNPAISFDANGVPLGISEEEGYGITSKEIASRALDNLTEALGTARAGLKDDNSYIVLNATRMPAMIIEGAYLSNEEDFAKLSSTEEYSKRYAYAVAKAIIESFNERFPD